MFHIASPIGHSDGEPIGVIVNSTTDRLQIHYQSPHALRHFPGNAKVHTKAQ